MFCRPSCPSRQAHPNNVQLHKSVAVAEAAGFRACPRCNPAGVSIDVGYEQLVAQVVDTSIHEGKNEPDFGAPIVSLSMGVPAYFVWDSAARSERTRRVRIEHGDTVAWGGSARLNFHGIELLRDSHHPLTGSTRFNRTCRRALSRG